MGSYPSNAAAETVRVLQVTDEASLLAHVMGDDIDGALRIAESMSDEQRKAFTIQLNRTCSVLGFAGAREDARAQFTRSLSTDGA